MHPYINYEFAKARIADMERQAQGDALARAARRARHPRTDKSKGPARTRRVYVAWRTLLGALQ